MRPLLSLPLLAALRAPRQPRRRCAPAGDLRRGCAAPASPRAADRPAERRRHHRLGARWWPPSAAGGGRARRRRRPRPITPAAPQYCKVLGRIAPVDPKAPPILFQVNLPTQWNGRSVQYGGGGFNGVLITGLSAGAGRAASTQPSPLAQGYVTVGTDSGHQNQPGAAAAGLRAQRRGAGELRPRVVQEGARRVGRADEARLRPRARTSCTSSAAPKAAAKG